MSAGKHKAKVRRWEILRWIGEGRMLPSSKGYNPHFAKRDLDRLISDGDVKLERRRKGSMFGRHIRRTFLVPARWPR